MTLNLKRIFLISFLLIQLTILNANSLDFYFTVKRFFETQDNQNFVELAFLIPGNGVNYKELSPNNFQAQVLVAVDLKNNNNDIIFSYAYVVKSPYYTANPNALVNLSDVINFPIPTDSVQLLIQVLDINDSTNYFTDQLYINALDVKKTFISDISLIAQKNEGRPNDLFFKNGGVMVPKFINYYPTETNKLSFYLESYQLDSAKSYLVKYFISDENNIIIDKYSNFKKMKGNSVEAIYAEFDITNLPSGNFYLYAEIKDTENRLLDRKRMYFQRYNKNDELADNIDYYELGIIKDNFANKYDLRNISHHLKALKPIANAFEITTIESALNSKDLGLMQKYFYSFWSSRDTRDPEGRWKEYAKLLQFVEQEFGNSLIEGHDTARGRVYLRYGKPDERLERNTPQNGRIELWTYEQIEKEGDVKFVFQESELSNDEYILVHTTLNNEIFSKEWAQILKTKNF